MDCQEEQLKAGKRPDEPDFAIQAADDPSSSGTLNRVTDGGQSTYNRTSVKLKRVTYQGFYNQLVKALAGEDSLPVDALEAKQVIRLIELAKLSSELGMTLTVKQHHTGIDV